MSRSTSRAGLSTRLDDAERLKVMHGSALPGSADDRDILTVPPIGEDDRDLPTQVPRSAMTRIIRARIEETLELIRDRLNQSGFGSVVGKRVVLTGGASQLDRPAGGGAPHPRPQRPHRPAARRRGPAGSGQGPGLLDGGRPDDLSAGRADSRAVEAGRRLRCCGMTGTGGTFPAHGAVAQETVFRAKFGGRRAP